MPHRRRCAALALGAVAAVLLWQALAVHFNYRGNWSALFFTGGLQRIPPEFASSTWVFPNSTGYDGQFYRYIAHDPRPDGRYALYVDDPSLRYKRILLPALAHITGAPDGAFVLLVAGFTGLGVYWSGRYFVRHGRSAAWGLLFVVTPAAMSSFDRLLLDGALLALFVAFVLYLEEGRIAPLLAVCLAAPLVRETGVILPFAGAAHFLAGRAYRLAALAAGCTVPAAVWWLYVESRTPTTEATGAFGVPIFGIIQRLLVFRDANDALTHTLLRITDVPAVAGLLLAIFLGVRELRHVDTTGGRVAVGCFAALAAVLASPAYLLDPGGFSRPVSPLLWMLAALAVLGRPKINAFPLAAMSVAVGLYFLSPAAGIVRGVLGVIR
jgi:hypothetical protein